MASTFLCGSSRNKGPKHQYSHSNSHNRKRNTQNHFRTSTDNVNTERYIYNENENEHGIESSISNLEENDIVNEDEIIEEEEEEEEQDEISPQISISYNGDDNKNNLNIPNIPNNDFNLNYHGHIENHGSPRPIINGSNPYELIMDQKKLHKTVKSVHYPYLSWHWFDNRFEPVIDVQRRKYDPGPVILRLDGKTYPKCIPCSRDNMDREPFNEETILNIIKWSLRHFICYCAEYNHDCTYIKKSKNYKIKLTQSIQQSKNLLKDKIKLQKRNDLLFHKLSNIQKHYQKQQYDSHSQDFKDLKTYKESSKHWKKECAKEKKNLQNTTRDFQELLKNSNNQQIEYNKTIKQQKKEIQYKNDEINKFKIKQNELIQINKKLNNEIEEIENKYKIIEIDKKNINNKLIEIEKENTNLKNKIIELNKQNKETLSIVSKHNLTKIKELEKELKNNLNKYNKQTKQMQIEREKDIELLKNKYNNNNNNTAQSDNSDIDINNKLHPTWNLYDWYNKEETLQVIDDILSGDALDYNIQIFFNSLRDQHGYIHEALVNNEWNIWKFVQECKNINNYTDSLKKLLDEHPRIYAALHVEELLNEYNEYEQAEDEEEEQEYEEEEEYEQEYEYDEYKNNNNNYQFIDIDNDNDIKNDDHKIYDFQTHPEYAIAFICNEIGQIKLFQIRKNDVRLIKYSNMRYNIKKEDHKAFCCSVSPSGDYVAFGGSYDNNKLGIIVCYKIKSKNCIQLKFVINNNNNNIKVRPIYSIEFDETGQLLFAGNNIGDVWVFNVNENGKYIQNIGYIKNKNKINDLCFHSNYIFVLTSTMCFAYYCNLDDKIQEMPININTLQIIKSFDNKNINKYKYFGVASFGFDSLIIYIASNVLQYYILPIDSTNNKILINNNNKPNLIHDDDFKLNNSEITSLHIDHKNEYVLVSTNESVKSYKITDCNSNNGPIKTIDRQSIAKIAVHYKYGKYVAICYQNPCSIEIKKFVKK